MTDIKNNSRRKWMIGSMSMLALSLFKNDFLKVGIANLTEDSSWTPGPEIVLTPDSTFDLASTLPNNVIRGGRFVVDLNSGRSLPEGVELSENGIIKVKSMSEVHISEVVFIYEEPESILGV